MEYAEHIFGPGETTKGIIRKFNRTQDDNILKALFEEFKKLNDIGVPRIGDLYKIPVYNPEDLPRLPKKTKMVQKPKLVFNNPNPPEKKEQVPPESFEVKNFTLEGSRIETLTEESEYNEAADLEAMSDRQKRREQKRKLYKVKVEVPEELKQKEAPKSQTPSKPSVETNPKKVESEQKKKVETVKKIIVKKQPPTEPKNKEVIKRTAPPPQEPVKREKKRLVNTSTISKHRRR